MARVRVLPPEIKASSSQLERNIREGHTLGALLALCSG